MLKKICFVCVIVFITTIYTNFAQTENHTKESYRKGLEIVNKSLEAIGGKSALSKIDDVSFTLAGTLYSRNQSYLPDKPFDKFSIETKAVIDLKKEQVSWEQRNGLPGGIFFANRVAGNLEGGFNLDLSRKIHTKLTANPPPVWLAMRLFTPFFLQKVVEQKQTLRSIGEVNLNNKKHEAVVFYWRTLQFTLYFDSETKLLTKYEFIAPGAFSGDDLWEFYSSDYQNFDGLLLPTKYKQIRSGDLIRESIYSDYKFNQKPDESFFKLPENYPLFEQSAFAIKPLAKDIYLAEVVAGGYRSLIVNLNDGILVVDAPVSSNVCSQLINEIKKAIPNKPIKYLVATHFHDDHTGGIRSFVAEGSKIITTKRNENFFKRFAGAEYTINPDTLSRQPKPIDFMFVEKNQSFSYAEGTVEIYKLDKNSHAKDLYVVYLPKEKIVFQSDLYNWKDKAVNTATVEFIDEIEKLGWQVETVIGSHSGAVPYQQIKDEITEFKIKR